ncbi:MAG TPA: hypothetical protein P5509_04865 [Bacteroidales bacterium]|nr:hypothetical protein [Bacteroidales bacterium]
MDIKVLSYNFHRRYYFDIRESLLNDLLNKYEFDILFAQEYLKSNSFDKLNENYEKTETYMNPIFYRKDKFELLSFFAAEHNKFVCAKLKHADGQEFYVCNLHLNYGYYKIKETRRIKQLDGYLAMLNTYEELPTIISGDFNCLPTDETLNLLSDYTNTYISGNSLKEYTNNEYSTVCNNEIIDHTFVKGFDVIDYNIISDDYDGQLPSDHNPVYSRIRQNI